MSLRSEFAYGSLRFAAYFAYFVLAGLCARFCSAPPPESNLSPPLSDFSTDRFSIIPDQERSETELGYDVY